MAATKMVELKKIGGMLRTVQEGTTRLARNAAGTPIDGGGWPDTPDGRSTGGRQIGHVNTSIEKSRRRIT